MSAYTATDKIGIAMTLHLLFCKYTLKLRELFIHRNNYSYLHDCKVTKNVANDMIFKFSFIQTRIFTTFATYIIRLKETT